MRFTVMRKISLLFELCILTIAVFFYTIPTVKAQQLIPPEEIDLYYYYTKSEVKYNYNALKQINLYDKPNGTTTVATIAPGEPVERITVLSITTPRKYPIKILNDKVFYRIFNIDEDVSVDMFSLKECGTIVAEAGDTMYVMRDFNDCNGKLMAWYKGYIISIRNYCINDYPSIFPKEVSKIWGKYDGLEPAQSEEWIKLKKLNGKTGWTKCNYSMLQIDING